MSRHIRTFRAFRNRNYRLFFAGQSVSQIGTWMQRTGVSWLVYSITHSTFMLGLTVFSMQFPSFLLSLFGGILSDRHNRYRILLITQSASMVQAMLLAALVLRGHYRVWEILALSALLGTINAFDVPARQPLVHELISDKSELPNALALNSSMVNLARMLGPALSGIVLETWGAGICFLINALSFFAVIGSLLLLRLPPYEPLRTRTEIFRELGEGFTYLKRTPSIGIIILMLALMALLVLPYNTLMPVFAKEVFHGDAATYGYINSFIGLGAIAGTFFLASLHSEANFRKVLLINTLLLGFGLMLFSHTALFPPAMVFAVMSGFGTMSQTAISNTIIQVESDARMRGRVISYFAMTLFGMMPLGSLLTGAISQRIGAQDTILGQGILAIILVMIFRRLFKKPQVQAKRNTMKNMS